MSELRAQPRDAPRRCPYCHDHLANERAELIVTCGACGTHHHAVCLAELGRCTVMGCERPMAAPALPPDVHLSAIARTIRRRARDRVRGFVRRNVSPAPRLEDLMRQKELEAEIEAWLPEFLQEALRDPAPYDVDRQRVLMRVAARRGLLASDADFAGLVRGWSDQALRQCVGDDKAKLTLAQRHTVFLELRRRSGAPGDR